MRFFRTLGPGLVTGAADDDPSGISTYSVAGAALGYGPLWTALFSFPLMAAVQLMSARLGTVTGRGLAGAVRMRYSREVLWGACTLLALANIINTGADLGGMAEVTGMVTHSNALIWTPLYTGGILALLFWSNYRSIARIFKWLTVVLFAYIITAFLAHPDWRAVLRATFLPQLSMSHDFFAVLTGILGTTISPYLMFWQASQEVEEQRKTAKENGGKSKARKTRPRRGMDLDVIVGMLFSNLVMYFIILTTAATLHAHGKTNIGSAREAAEALLPLAGDGAYWLFAVGLIGTGMLGVPVLVRSLSV